MNKKIRIDRLLVERGLAPSRERAGALVMAGCAFVRGIKVSKPGQQVDPAASLELRGQDHPFVGRGGVKLAGALGGFGLDPRGKICLDVGASTGGFTDCLLQRGAAKVYAVDVGYGQLAWNLVRDARVVVLDRTNIREIGCEEVPDGIEVAAIDVSFISLTLVLPAVDPLLAPGAEIVALVKPQFEVGRGRVGKGGVVRDTRLHEEAVERARQAGLALGWALLGERESELTGPKGNREFFLWFRKPKV